MTKKGGKRLININYRDSRPIYRQIKDEIKRMMMAWIIKPDQKLESVRELAVQTAINPNTIARSYRELEAEGFIYSVTGKGSFASNVAEMTQAHANMLFERFKEVSRELVFLNFDTEKMIKYINDTKGGGADDRGSDC